jgi:hypothetical protein
MTFERKFTYITLQDSLHLIIIATLYKDTFRRSTHKTFHQIAVNIDEPLFAVRAFHLGTIYVPQGDQPIIPILEEGEIVEHQQ